MTTLAPLTQRRSHSGDAWNDRLLEAVERWPLPLWASLPLLYLATGALLHAIEWFLGPVPVGEFSPFIASLPAYPLGILALIAAQNRVSTSALARYRRATDLDDAAYEAVRHDLTHQPAMSAALLGFAFGALGVVIEVTKEGNDDRLAQHPAAYVSMIIFSFAFYAFAGPWVVRTVRLLRQVDRLHRRAVRIDLLDPDPLHALSSVTSLVGFSFVAVTSFSMVTDPETHQTTAGLALTLILLAFAVASFILPLWGMHRRLQTEKARLGGEVGRRIEITTARLYAHVDEDRPGATEERDRLLALVATRDLIDNLGTWPWRPETPRWLISALIIPLALWGLTRLLERTGL
ncbi:MAG: hypothetical protein AMXMBFR23_25830 [Chloroflexota bacterium]